jgi:hypothetical protein
MKSVKAAFVLFGLAGALLSSTAQSAPGRGWDFYNMGAGDPISVGTQAVSASGTLSAGKGWDFMQNGAGERIPVSNRVGRADVTDASAGKGWDFFNMGLGEHIPVQGRHL